MHYGALVILPPGYDGPIDEAVGKMLAPYDENLELVQETDDDGDTYWTNPRSFWDWWQIGGRWTGYLSDYDPRLDPNNIETCSLCHGSGTRLGGLEQFGQAWFDGCGGCNGCNGLGSRTKWPTAWSAHPGDIQPWSAIKDQILSGDKSFYTVVAGEQVAHREVYVPDAPQGECFQPTGEVETLLLHIPDDAICVVVDYHC